MSQSFLSLSAMRFLFFRLFVVYLFAVSAHGRSDSTCFGTTANGRLENGVTLPGRGDNYIAYSNIARLAGRTHVHSDVREIVVAAYAQLASELPDKVYKYAETGFKNGGVFKPHKTHQNGLSVDFMTPMIDSDGRSRHLPTHPANRFGYDIEFDDQGRYLDLEIDYPAMAAHVATLHKEARKRGLDIWRVIFDPKLQAPLFSTRHGPYLKKHIQFSARPSWVRHDEHYHIDFDVPCK